MSIYSKNSIGLAISVVLTGMLVILGYSPVQAYSLTFDNGDFEDIGDTLSDNDGWEGVGSAEIRGSYSNVAPYDSRQGVITTGCPSSIQTGECLDSDGDGQPRNDDSPTAAGTYNLLGQDLLSASSEATGNLQTSLGLSDNALTFQREIDGTPLFDTSGDALYKVAKEGSAISQTITITDDGISSNNIVFSFDWDFVTNDGSGDLGGKDFGFFSISGNGVEEVIVLEESLGNLPVLNSGDTNFANNVNTYASYTTDPLPLNPGVYQVGFGVVDADGVNYSSGLLFDNFEAREVPFEFSPGFGLVFFVTLVGWSRLRHSSTAGDRKQENQIT